MKIPVLTSEIETVLRRIIWFEEPSQAINDPIRVIAYAMTYGAHEDMKVIRRLFSSGSTYAQASL